MNSQKLIDTLRRAGHFYEGDSSSGQDMFDEKTREEARKELSLMPVGIFNHTVLVDDEVSETLARHLNWQLADEIAHVPLERVKEILLGKGGASFVHKHRDGMSSELISALVKIMTNEELSVLSLKIFNPLPGEGSVTVGSSNHFGSRIQPNSAGDKEEEIFFAILDGLSYGCGDVMIGLNPACDDVETVTRLVDFLADVVESLHLPTRFCVLSDIVKLTRAKELGAKVDLGFQSLAGTAKALKGMIGCDVKEISRLAEGFLGLYFEIGMGLEVTNESDEGVDMRTLTSRAAGLARYIQQVTGKWTVVNTVTNFIGPEVFRTEEQLFRAALEDIAMLKLHGLTGGIDVCAPFHMGIHPERLRAVTEKIIEWTHPAFIMSIAGGVDDMLGYETSPSRMYPAICVAKKSGQQMTSVMKNRLTELGIIGPCGLVKATPETVEDLFIQYQLAKGDMRWCSDICAEVKRKISVLQGQNLDIGYGCPVKFVDPPLMKKRVHDIYETAQKSLYSRIEPAVLKDASPKRFETITCSIDREDYLRYPKTGNTLRQGEEAMMRMCYQGCQSDVLIVISGGLNADAINENLKYILPGIRQGFTGAGFSVSFADVVATNGRVRLGYTIGKILQVPLVIHLIGERRGIRLDTLSAYITYGKDAQGNFRWDTDMDHSFTTAVCGIHRQGKHPDDAVDEIVRLVKLMFERRCSGIELN